MGSAFDDDLSEEREKLRNPQPVAGPGAPPAASGAKRGFSGVLSDIGQTADDVARAAVDTASFGLADRGLEASGLEPGAIERTRQARARSPWATIGGDVAGGLATMAATPLRVLGAGAASMLGGARAGLPGFAGRAAGYGAEGAAVGAGQAAGHTYDLESLPGNVAQGAALGGVGGAVMGPLTPRASLAPRPRAEVPTPGELNQARDMLYTAGRNNPGNVYHTGPAVRTLADTISDDLGAAGFHYKNAKNTFASLDMVAEAERRAAKSGIDEAVFSPGDIESIRQAFNNSTKPPDIAASRIAKEAIDNFTANPTAGGLSSGTVRGAQAADNIFETARGNAAAAIRSGKLREAEQNVERASATRNSGRNYENNMRSKVASILASEGRSFPRAEREGLENLARRTDAWNTVREIGNMLGGGGGIGTWVAPAVLGGAAGGATAYGGGDPVSTALSVAAPILAGRTLRGMSNRSMQNAVGQMDEMIRSNSPEFARRQAITPGTIPGAGTSAGTLAARDAVTEALIRREQDKPLRITVHPQGQR